VQGGQLIVRRLAAKLQVPSSHGESRELAMQLWHDRSQDKAVAFLKPHTLASSLPCSIHAFSTQSANDYPKFVHKVAAHADGGYKAPTDLNTIVEFPKNKSSVKKCPRHQAHHSIRDHCEQINASLSHHWEEVQHEKRSEVEMLKTRRREGRKVEREINVGSTGEVVEPLEEEHPKQDELYKKRNTIKTPTHQYVQHKIKFSKLGRKEVREAILAQMHQHDPASDPVVKLDPHAEIQETTRGILDALDSLSVDLEKRKQAAHVTIGGDVGRIMGGHLATCEEHSNRLMRSSSEPVALRKLRQKTQHSRSYKLLAWGDERSGGKIPDEVASRLEGGVAALCSNGGAFAALLPSGAVVTWGDSDFGGGVANGTGTFSGGCTQVFPSSRAFVAVKPHDDGISVVSVPAGTDVELPCSQDDEFASVQARHDHAKRALQQSIQRICDNALHEQWVDKGFASLRSDGSVYTTVVEGIDHDTSQSLSSGVRELVHSRGAFAALTERGGVIAWGHPLDGGNVGSDLSPKLKDGVVELKSTEGAFAALKACGEVLCWGNIACGGAAPPLRCACEQSASVSNEVSEKYQSLEHRLEYQQSVSFSSRHRLSFVGVSNPADSVHDKSARGHGISSKPSGRVMHVHSTDRAFAALMDDGAVVTWGDPACGGEVNEAMLKELSSGVVAVCSSGRAFAALKCIRRSVKKKQDASNLHNSDSDEDDDDDSADDSSSSENSP